MGRNVFLFDPDGQALQLYYAMEQVGWNGHPRPVADRAPVGDDWPETVTADSDSYRGEPFLGPWN